MVHRLCVIAIVLWLMGCERGDTYNRGYVISHSEIETDLSTQEEQ